MRAEADGARASTVRLARDRDLGCPDLIGGLALQTQATRRGIVSRSPNEAETMNPTSSLTRVAIAESPALVAEARGCEIPSVSELLESDCVVLVNSTIPAHMTIAEWRRVRGGHAARPRRGRRLRRLWDWTR
jgi:hypothetical protein